MISINEKKILGINGSGRIGKLTIWHHLLSRKVDGLVVNVGREVGKHLEDYIQQLCTDSTYGNLSFFLYGRAGKQVEVKIIDHDKNMIEVDGFPIKLLITERIIYTVGIIY